MPLHDSELMTTIQRELLDYKRKFINAENQIKMLKEQLHDREIKIVQLNKKLHNEHQTNQNLMQKIYSKEVMIKQNNKSLYAKNLQIQELEDKLQNSYFDQRAQYQNKIKQLTEIIYEQEKQLSAYMDDHANVLASFSQIYHKKQYQYEELNLLRNYNRELSSQIEDVQNINETLLKQREEYQNEVGLQNEQGNDMMVQMQEMMDNFRKFAIKTNC